MLGHTAMLPDFVIIGAMKCATTTLYEQLNCQPGIYLPELKEPNFFSDDHQYAKGLAWYQALFEDARSDDLLGEASTHYTKLPVHPDTIGRMHSHLPSAKLIYVMRHPVDRLISHYMHEWSQGIISCDINEAIVRYPELRHYSRYAYQLAPYIETYGRDNVLPLFFEQLKTSPQSVLERACDFIGYKGKPLWQDALAPSNVSTQRIRKFPFYNLLVDSAPSRFMRRTFVPKALRERVKHSLQMSERPELSEASKRSLVEIFDQDLHILGEWFGVELSCENFRTCVSKTELNWQPGVNSKEAIG